MNVNVNSYFSYNCWGSQPSEQARAMLVTSLMGWCQEDHGRSEDGEGEFASEPAHKRAVGYFSSVG